MVKLAESARAHTTRHDKSTTRIRARHGLVVPGHAVPNYMGTWAGMEHDPIRIVLKLDHAVPARIVTSIRNRYLLKIDYALKILLSSSFEVRAATTPFFLATGCFFAAATLLLLEMRYLLIVRV